MNDSENFIIDTGDSDDDVLKFVWVTDSPISPGVGLKQSTYDDHVVLDHPNDRMRSESYPYIQPTISSPRFIYWDHTDPNQKRQKYMDVVAIPGTDRLYNLSIVVDTDRTPHEVVTWMVKRDLKQEDISGGVLYDARTDSK